ncbi:Hsp20/alpha crystallin family protein [Halorussus ruber]|uniref:Hsp20/alpha crystallin family protein n=1 Tax=Halorussus ruber TaxID=1126238 RepID=UPI001FEA2CE7|nr:Hsp20/alpha crystallin family protein [Halorussus ruber]
MFEQLRTRVWTPEGSLSGGRGVLAREGEDVSMDLTKHDEEYVFVADLPGFEREDIDLRFSDGMLTLVAESETSDERTVGEAARGEKIGRGEETRPEGEEIAIRSQFARSRRVAERVTIPESIVEDEIAASYRNGVLEVHLPLAEPAADDESRIDIID